MAYGARSNANLLPLRNICVTELIKIVCKYSRVENVL
jgi:hypothetical protein